MSMLDHPQFLRRVLLADAAASGATGLLMLLGTDALASMLALPAGLLFYAGAALVPFAALVAWLGLRESPPRLAVWAIIACNLLWAAESILMLFGSIEPNRLGQVFVLGQALVVALFAELEYFGLRRQGALAA